MRPGNVFRAFSMGGRPPKPGAWVARTLPRNWPLRLGSGRHDTASSLESWRGSRSSGSRGLGQAGSGSASSPNSRQKRQFCSQLRPLGAQVGPTNRKTPARVFGRRFHTSGRHPQSRPPIQTEWSSIRVDKSGRALTTPLLIALWTTPPNAPPAGHRGSQGPRYPDSPQQTQQV